MAKYSVFAGDPWDYWPNQNAGAVEVAREVLKIDWVAVNAVNEPKFSCQKYEHNFYIYIYIHTYMWLAPFGSILLQIHI